MAGLVLLNTALPYIFCWDSDGRKGQACRIVARGDQHSCMVEFADGARIATTYKAIRRNQRQRDVDANNPG